MEINFDASIRALHIHNRSMATIPIDVVKLTSLETLSLENNNITSLPEVLPASLTTVNLRGNNLLRIPDCLRRLPRLQHLSLDGNPCMAQYPEGLDGVAIFAYEHERDKSDPIVCLSQRPPLPVCKNELYEQWECRGTEVWHAMVTMLQDWAFLPPITDDKWTYVLDYVFPLARLWGCKAHFATLQRIARAGKHRLEEQAQALLAPLAVPTLAPFTVDNVTWIPSSYLTASEETPLHKEEWDQAVLPTMLRHLAMASYDAFRTTLIGIVAQLSGATLRCDQTTSLKSVQRIRAKIADSQHPWPKSQHVWDCLRASITLPTMSAVGDRMGANQEAPVWPAIGHVHRIVVRHRAAAISPGLPPFVPRAPRTAVRAPAAPAAHVHPRRGNVCFVPAPPDDAFLRHNGAPPPRDGASQMHVGQ